LLDVSFADLALDVEGFEGDGVVCDDGDSVPDVLGSFFFEECYAPGVLAAQHGGYSELEFLFAAGRNYYLLDALAVQQICLYSKRYRFLLVRVFDIDFSLDCLFGLAFDFDVLFGERFFSVSENLVFEVVES
jgi:hypothetical protein